MWMIEKSGEQEIHSCQGQFLLKWETTNPPKEIGRSVYNSEVVSVSLQI
jgi:hypothetical protein